MGFTHNTFDITTGNFQAEVLDSPLPVLVEFGADWCPPCKMIAPFVDEIARLYETRLRVGTIDADADPQIVQEYGVMGLPTLILFQNGKPVQRIIGFQPRQRIEAQIVPYLTSSPAK